MKDRLKFHCAFSSSVLANWRLLVILTVSRLFAQKVELLPYNPIYFLGNDAVFTCEAQNAVGVRWYINGTMYSSPDIVFSSAIDVGILRIHNISTAYNWTCIQCEGEFSHGMIKRSENRTLLLQGILDPVDNVQYVTMNRKLNISWCAPFSFDVPDYDPDILYCVDVLSISSSTISYSQCHINHTYFSYTEVLGVCTKYGIHITAVNPVGNSTVVKVLLENKGFDVVNVSLISMVDKSKVLLQLVMSQEVCLASISLHSEDEIVLPREDNTTNVVVFELEDNRLYRNVFLKDTLRNVTIYLGSLSTYDVLNFYISSNNSNLIYLQTTFANGSLAEGVLYVFLYVENVSLNFERSVYFTVKKNDAERGVIKQNIASGSYIGLAYDIEHNGLLQKSVVPSVMIMFNVTGSLYAGNMSRSSVCSAVRSIRLIVTVVCQCEEGTHLQVLLHKWNGIEQSNNISTARGLCLNPIRFQLQEEGSYYIVAFVEQVNGSIVDAMVIFSELIVVNITFDGTSSQRVFNSTANLTDGTAYTGGLLVICLYLSITVLLVIQNIVDYSNG